jgi:hypothetical protein
MCASVADPRSSVDLPIVFAVLSTGRLTILVILERYFRSSQSFNHCVNYFYAVLQRGSSHAIYQ